MTGTLDSNAGWGPAFSRFNAGETEVFETGTAITVGRYVTITRTLFKVHESLGGSIFVVRDSAGAAGNYTATTNGAYAWIEYYSQWQTD